MFNLLIDFLLARYSFQFSVFIIAGMLMLPVSIVIVLLGGEPFFYSIVYCLLCSCSTYLGVILARWLTGD